RVTPRHPQPHAQRFWGKDPYPEHHYWVNPPLRDARANLSEAMTFACRSSDSGGAWTVYVDEIKLLSDAPSKHGLGPEPYVIRFLRYGRGKGMSFIGATQSPRYVTSDLYDQPSWHF